MICSARCRMCHVTHCGQFAHATALHHHDNRQTLSSPSSSSPRDLSSYQFQLGAAFRAVIAQPQGEPREEERCLSPCPSPKNIPGVGLIQLLVIIRLGCVRRIISASYRLVCWNLSDYTRECYYTVSVWKREILIFIQDFCLSLWLISKWNQLNKCDTDYIQ